MRLIIKIEPSEDFSADVVYKHTIQGFIYECLRDVDEFQKNLVVWKLGCTPKSRHQVKK